MPAPVSRRSSLLRLCCFSGWGRHEAQKHNAVARDATQKLKTEGVAAAAALLDAQCDYEDAATADAVDVKALLHEAGVNLRYLGARARLRV